jgi:diguanylate cyclase (GGDEF)-like protein/PAS domain S-box-containing protein
LPSGRGGQNVLVPERGARLFERAFAGAPIGMAIVALDGSFERVNDAFCRLLGREREELEGMPWAETVHPADRPAAEAWLAALPDRGSGRTDELRYPLADGSDARVVKAGALVVDEQGIPERYICQFLDVSERRRYEAELEHRALHDHLTALPNRALLADRLHQAVARQSRTGETVGVVSVDLDDFKRINDSLGHEVGDRILGDTARRLERVMRPGDTICRIGGDGFVVLCEGLGDDSAQDSMVEVAHRLLDAVAERPFRVAGRQVSLHASAGVAIASPAVPLHPDRILAESEAAMYRAKRRGQGMAELADDETRTIAHRLGLESDLRAALRDDSGDLWLAYQPIVDLPGGAMVGLEALLRWDRPGHGPVSPVELIPVADDAGLMPELGDWVMRRALEELSRWRGERRPYVAINLSPHQFASSELVDTLGDRIAEHHIDPAGVSLEITEGVAMADGELALETMRALTDLGVQIAIDDFGTGFSSLAYLKRFPVDTLKIDRVFVSEVASPSGDRAIVSAVISMAAALGVDVVAEGVETEQQRRTLTRLGCRRAQGFLFGRPVPMEELVR